MSFQSIPFWSLLQKPEIGPTGFTYGRFALTSASSNQIITYSDNKGETWSSTANIGFFTTNARISFSNELSQFAIALNATSTSNIITSYNGLTWSAGTKPRTFSLGSTGLVWCKAFNKWYGAVMNLGVYYVFSSTDGISWIESASFSTIGGNYGVNSIIYAETPNGNVFGFSTSLSNNPPRFVYTYDETNWTDVQIGVINTYQPTMVSYSPDHNLFLWGTSLGNSTQGDFILTSSDLINFGSYSLTRPGSTFRRQDIHWGKDKFVSCLERDLFTTTPIQYSSTGLSGSWTYSTFPNAQYFFFKLVYAKEIDTWLVTRSNANNIYTSPDGITWTQRSAPRTTFAAAFGGGIS